MLPLPKLPLQASHELLINHKERLKFVLHCSLGPSRAPNAKIRQNHQNRGTDPQMHLFKPSNALATSSDVKTGLRVRAVYNAASYHCAMNAEGLPKVTNKG